MVSRGSALLVVVAGVVGVVGFTVVVVVDAGASVVERWV